MKSEPKFLKIALATLSFTLVVIAWLFLAPTQFGGDTSYIIVAGTSMLPRFELGDLVIVKEKDTYTIGDIVAYNHPEIGPIFHRIVEQEGRHFILQGDNNDFLDSYHPTKEEIIGKLWVYLPDLGKFLVYLRTPFVFSVLVIAVGFVSYISIFGDTARSKSPRRKPKVSGVPMSELKENTIEMFFVLAVIAIGSLILGVAAYTRPTKITTTEMVPYEHTGAFFYTAEAVEDIYDQETVQPGEPLFRLLTDDFTVAFSYRLMAPELTNVKGSYQMVAVIGDTNGWKRTLQLEPETEFEGGSFSVSSTVDLDQIQAIIDTLERRTGYVRGQYILSIKPVVSVSGALDEKPFGDAFTPTLDFFIDDVMVKLGSEEPGIIPMMKFSEVGMISREIVVPNKLKIVSFEVTVMSAQIVSLVGLIFSAACMLYMGMRLRTASAEFTLPHLDPGLNPAIVSLEGSAQLEAFLQEKPVADIASLAQGMIVHQSQGDVHHYYAQAEGLVYHYSVQSTEETVADEVPFSFESEPEPETPGFFKRVFSRFRRTNGANAQPPADTQIKDDDLVSTYNQEETKD
jgi:signal peptidase I